MKNWWQPHHACDKHDIKPAPGIHGQSRKIKALGLFLIIGRTALVIQVQTTIRTAIIASFYCRCLPGYLK